MSVETNDKKAISKIVDEMTLFDDDLMSLVFDMNIEATEYVLQIILDREIKVISVKGQENFRNPLVKGRSITLDVHAIDSDGQEIDIEVQSGSRGAHVRRARFHSSMTDSRMLKETQEFRELKDSYIIFIYRHDKFQKGLPVYHINRYVEETGEYFGDGSHIIYVNGNYKGNDKVGKLMQDFHQCNAKRINSKVLADGVRHFKETEEGRKIMCEAVEKYAEERAERVAKKVAKEATIELVIKKVKKGYSIETIADALEEKAATIRPIYEAVVNAAPDYDVESIYESIK